ncbi:hypothetical protein BRADI_4g23654v3 [Brachypodium distachyon]|uniref:Peptidase A1 domain-containing protein n=1 Tax=Brachypodium distachyon TaxID=15368 RepID=A0A2K2CPQ9_BRADI|nr:hypothetical protein BRADI_4g23654v3 [Brachypodium distachyon]
MRITPVCSTSHMEPSHGRSRYAIAAAAGGDGRASPASQTSISPSGKPCANSLQPDLPILADQSFTVPHKLYKPRRSNLVPCEDERCVALHRDVRFKHDCKENPNQCDYDVRYAGGESSLGVLIADKFSLPGRDARPTLTFGCGYDQEGGKAEMPVDGVLGIGRGTRDLASQLKQQGAIAENVIGHCLRIQGGGYLFFGHEKVPSSVVTWVPMVPNNHYYSPGLAALHFNGNLGNPISVAPMEVVIDSGSTYTYMPTETYRRLVFVVIASLSKSSLTLVRDPALPVCWAGKEPFK